jgi:hypothetical protein
MCKWLFHSWKLVETVVRCRGEEKLYVCTRCGKLKKRYSW